MINQLVKKGFDRHLKEMFGQKPDILKWILSHPRRELFEKNLCQEIRLAEFKFGARMNVAKLNLLITHGCNLFADCCINNKTKEMMSAAELKRHEQKAGELKDTQGLVDDMEKEYLSTAVTKSVKGIKNENSLQPPQDGAAKGTDSAS